jgi:four helix bundle protein
MRHENLRVFHLADELVLCVYASTRQLPAEERFGLQSQMRRAAVSVVSNIVEGAGRGSQREYCTFLRYAYASAKELEYQLSLCDRLGYLPDSSFAALQKKCNEITGSLFKLRRAVESATQSRAT